MSALMRIEQNPQEQDLMQVKAVGRAEKPCVRNYFCSCRYNRKSMFVETRSRLAPFARKDNCLIYVKIVTLVISISIAAFVHIDLFTLHF